jgi:hypothetical protein
MKKYVSSLLLVAVTLLSGCADMPGSHGSSGSSRPGGMSGHSH